MIAEREFENLFRANFANMCNFAYTIVKDQDAARDITQQAFVNLWNRREDIDLQTNIRSYLNRAIVNLGLNYIDRHKRIQLEEEYTQSQLGSMVTPEGSDFFSGEVETAVRSAIEKLQGKCQTVFSLSRFEGLSNKEIAETLDISIKSVEKYITKALKELRDSLKPYMEIIGNFLIFGVGLNLVCLFL